MSKRKTTQQFIEDAYCKHGDRYNYKLVQYKNAKTKVNIICPKHGVFEQTPRYHIKGSGCPKCAGKLKKTIQQFIEDARKVHGNNYNYSLVEYNNTHSKVKIICPVHGVFEQIPNSHLRGYGCSKCGRIKQSNKLKKTTEQFIIDAYCKHGDKYNYKLVNYKNKNTKIKIICPEHGIFEQRAGNHLNGQGCPKCAGKLRKTTEQFIIDAYCKHGDKYNYKLVQYKNRNTKVKIICPVHGVFEQTPRYHLQGYGCSKCSKKYNKPYTKNNIPVYDNFIKQLEPYGIVCRRNKDDANIIEVKCMYCDRYYIPTRTAINHKIQSIKGNNKGESNLYCSNECKQACPTYGQILYPKDFKINTSREVQPALRKLVFERDDYTCQKCFATDVELHCHHYEGIEVNPIESADMDNCITLCKKCHNEIHKTDKCGMKDYKREKC